VPIVLAALSTGLVVSVSGCKACGGTASSSGGDSGDAGAHASPRSLTPEQAQKPLAKVGGVTITLGDYAAALENMDQFDQLRYQSTERRKELLDEMITIELLSQEAIAKGYDKEPLAQQEVRAILRDAMLAEARKGAPAPNDVPEGDVRAWFEAHKAEYKDPERRRVTAIVLKDEASARAALAAARKAPSSAEWGELVRSKSIDPQARASVPVDLAGDLGIVSPPGDARGENPRVPEEVRAAVFQIEQNGEVLDKVVAAGGKFYVVRLVQKLSPHERSFAEAERSIRVKLAQDKLRAREEELLASLRKTIKVEVDEAALSTVSIDPVAGPSARPDAGSPDRPNAGH
jgi:DNA-directed RNA polymerase subunit F